MAIQDAGSISEEVFEAKAPCLIPAEGIWAGTVGRVDHFDPGHFAGRVYARADNTRVETSGTYRGQRRPRKHTPATSTAEPGRDEQVQDVVPGLNRDNDIKVLCVFSDAKRCQTLCPLSKHKCSRR